MSKCIFVAGASGAIGRRLCPLLRADGWRVVGTTRSAQRAENLRATGVEPAIVDVFDAAELRRAVAHARPGVVIHQLTDLPFGLDPARMEAARIRNTRIREEGTRNLLAAAVAAGATRFIAQSIAFAYAPGPLPHREDAPIDPNARGVISLEQQVLTGSIEGLVLRYGRLYGPGTGAALAPAGGPVHVDAAADAARRAATRGGAGLYNVAEDDGTVDVRRAIEELGWSAQFRFEP